MSHTVYVYCYRAKDDRGLYRWRCSCSAQSKDGTCWPTRAAAESDAERHAQ